MAKESEWARRKKQMTSSQGRETHSRQTKGQANAAARSDSLKRCSECVGTGTKNGKPCPACKGVGGTDLKTI